MRLTLDIKRKCNFFWLPSQEIVDADVEEVSDLNESIHAGV